MEEFVDEYLPVIRENNPQTVCCLYEWTRNRVVSKTKDQILALTEEMAIGGDYRFGQKRRVQTRLPRGQELWVTETMRHDVFKVYSKWKADPEKPDAITVETHPHLVHRKMS
uniref:Uncharacterized protein n=1 Tax=Panagrolaimus davidi TaxID=227884 RepID=A0A914Q062_9BILA